MLKKIDNKVLRIIRVVACLIIAGVLCFVVSPMMTKEKTGIEAVRLSKDVLQGEIISESMVYIDNNVSENDLNTNTIRKIEDVVGKIAAQNLYANDFVNSKSLTTTVDSIEKDFYTMENDKSYFGITVPSLSSALGTYLRPGDVISISYYDEENEESVLPSELQYVKLVSITNMYGKEVKENPLDSELKENLPAMLVLEVNREQIKKLTYLESIQSFHVSFVYRGTKEGVAEYINLQDLYFEESEADE